MSRVLEPIALKRSKIDYLNGVENESWVTVNPKSQTGRYQLKDEYRVAEATFKKVPEHTKAIVPT